MFSFLHVNGNLGVFLEVISGVGVSKSVYVSNISKSPGSMSSPLDFQTEGPGFESHHGHYVVCLKNAQIRMYVVFFVLSKIEISTRGTFSSIAIEL